ncbi:hypothetical protein B0O80DRAFT_426407 [Mortierella sp. GBAus27b]|nr:hypothetical protein BGX31_004326 [Mortierella sp. GBA43]KAI8354374.1 hypothetical protein B0O80DRAFT_426407 [Mortierella sp. GBAus27b]
MSGPLSQAFRAQASSKVIAIPTRHDNKSAQRVVRWKDVLQYFENAKGLMNGEDAVLFLTDDDLEDLVPLRIAYHPGVVLEVVTVSGDQSDSSAMTIASDVGALTITDVSDGNALVAPAHISGHGYGTYAHQAMVQSQSKSNTNQFVDGRHGRLLEMDNTLAQQEQVQQLSQQVQQMQQRIQQTQQQLDDVSQQILEVGQQHKRELNRLAAIQYRIRAFLTAPSKEMSVPRLFVVLPASTSTVSGQHQPPCSQFRLYFLCECGTHTMGKSNNRVHEVHLAQHPGYDLDKHNEFFGKYGSYLLTMMYIIKYGATTDKLVVPPLAQLNIVEGLDIGQRGTNGHSDLEQLVNDTITYLKEVIEINDDAMDAALHQKLEQRQFNRYLKYVGDDRGSGTLRRMKTPDESCMWVCSDHLREHFESIAQNLVDIINVSGGMRSDKPGNVLIKTTSEAMAKRLCDAITMLCRIQTVENWRSLTEINLDLSGHRSSTRSTKESLSRLGNIRSLALDFGRFSMASYASHGELQRVIMEVARLGDLTLDDIEFIYQCHPVILKILQTPQEADESRLANILMHCSKINELRIGCLSERVLPLIKLVTSTQAKTLPSNNPSSLRVFSVMGEGLVPFSISKSYDNQDHIVATVTFASGSPRFDMESFIKVQKQQLVPVHTPLCDFIAEYGWSVKSLAIPWTFSDVLATMLDVITLKRGSKIVDLHITPTSLTSSGLDALHGIVERSQCLTSLQLAFFNLEQDKTLDMAELLLERYGKKLSDIKLFGRSIDIWIPRLAQSFPTRESFPALRCFSVGCYTLSDISQDNLGWLMSMVAAPPKQTAPSPSPPTYTASPIEELEAPKEPYTPLTYLRVMGLKFENGEWDPLIRALDFSSLERLSFDHSNFSRLQLLPLVERINVFPGLLPLKVLDFSGAKLYTSAVMPQVASLLESKAPQIGIFGIGPNA